MENARDPEDVKEFLTESIGYLESIEPILASLQIGNSNEFKEIENLVAAVFRSFHSIKGVAGFLSFSNIQEVTHKAEETLDSIRTGKRTFDRELGTALLEACDLLRKYLSNIASKNNDDGYENEKASIVQNLKSFSEANNKSNPPEDFNAKGSTRDSPDAPLLFTWLIDEGLIQKFKVGAIAYLESIEAELFKIMDAPANLKIFYEAGKSTEILYKNAAYFGFSAVSKLGNIFTESLCRNRINSGFFDPNELSLYFNVCAHLKVLLETQNQDDSNLAKAEILIKELQYTLVLPTTTNKSIGNSTPQVGDEKSNPSARFSNKNEIRVSVERIDKMVDLIEELGVVSTGVFSAADLSEDGNNLKQSASKLRNITEELQKITVSIRMVPLSTVFRKMIRLVGDVSAKLGKKVRLEIVGEQTELDKDAVDALQDPLVHILRNCVDHGLELPEERISVGKPETGIVKLQAWHSGGEAWISISDDGRGIARDKVFAKAVSQGLVSANTKLSDTEILAFLFHPGFSLAKEVTEFSGRGVGMDVVKKNIEGLKGRVDLESTHEKGTNFLIRLPMANALTESMLVRVGEAKYVLRVASIRETFQPSLDSITKLPNGDELVSLRGHFYPVIRLHELHEIDNSETQLDRGLVIIVENRGNQIGLFVDEVIGKIQAVIKQPPNLLKSSTTLAGCSIIGTESDDVALALDINAIEKKIFTPSH